MSYMSRSNRWASLTWAWTRTCGQSQEAWDELDAAAGTQTRKPITEIMRLSGDYHYNYAWGSLVVDDFFQDSIRRIARAANMEWKEAGSDMLIIKHRLPTCGRHQRK